MDDDKPQPPEDDAQRMLAGLRPAPQAARPRARRVWRGLALALAALTALGAGGAYAWAWFGGMRELELLRFTSMYVCLPLGVSLLLLFAALQKK